ncbi:hypothetical protein [Halobacteriovorax sp. CON-3]|uniref:hypothetical protein n=1 Tax=Halobacteriovorax sp. CON-3 TaxID=3157710 RepID=UPI00370FD9FC
MKTSSLSLSSFKKCDLHSLLLLNLSKSQILSFLINSKISFESGESITFKQNNKECLFFYNYTDGKDCLEFHNLHDCIIHHIDLYPESKSCKEFISTTSDSPRPLGKYPLRLLTIEEFKKLKTNL